MEKAYSLLSSLGNDADNDYLGNGMFAFDGAVLRLYGIPVIPHNSVTADNFLIGDFQNGAKYLTREGISLQFFEQDRDNVQKNLVTVRVEQRGTLIVPLPNSILTAVFSTLRADLQA